MALAEGARARRFDFALDAGIAVGVTVRDGNIVRCDAGRATPLLPVSAVRLPGRHLLGDQPSQRRRILEVVDIDDRRDDVCLCATGNCGERVLGIPDFR